jgi:ribonuclease J
MGEVTLRFYGGVEGEIGGNQILLQDGETQALLDFGYNFSRWREYFSFPTSMPKTLDEYFEVGLLPKEMRARESGRISREIGDCFVTHAHTDHWRGIPALAPGDEGGPTVHLGETAHRIVMMRGEKLRGCDSLSHLRFETFRTGKKIQLGNLEIVPFHVDHSIPGAYALLIHTSRGLVVYTGDLRLHGSYSRRMQKQFWETLEGEPVEALICEGTSIGEMHLVLTERDVQRLGKRYVQASPGLVLVNLSPLDVDRLRTFHRIAELTGRRLIATSNFMECLEVLEEEPGLDLPSPARGEISEYGEEEQGDLRRRPSEYILLTAFYRWKEIQEVQPPPGSVFILSTSEPFEEEAEIEFRRLMNWLNIYGIQTIQLHTSGHAFPEDLRRIVDLVEPKRLIPVHTAYPSAFGKLVSDILSEKHIEFIEPKRGQTYKI